jgi:tetratricopeptide (TPR) repeat protein
MVGIAEVHFELGKYKESEKLSGEGLKIAEALDEKGKRGVAQALDLLGNIQHRIGNARQAIGYHEQALSIDKEVFGDRHPNVAATLNNIGMAWYDLSDSRRAKEYFQQAYNIFREFYGDEHPHTRTVKEWLDGLK